MRIEVEFEYKRVKNLDDLKEGDVIMDAIYGLMIYEGVRGGKMSFIQDAGVLPPFFIRGRDVQVLEDGRLKVRGITGNYKKNEKGVERARELINVAGLRIY